MKVVYLKVKETELFMKIPISYIRELKKESATSSLIVHSGGLSLMSVVIHTLGPLLPSVYHRYVYLNKQRPPDLFSEMKISL